MPVTLPDDDEQRPYTVLSCCMSLDGYIDRATGPRLVLSNDDDLDRVDAVRAGCDALFVCAETMRNDNPRLLIKSAVRAAARQARGLPSMPTKVTVTERAKLNAEAQFFTAGDSEKLVYCAAEAVDDVHNLLDDVATVVD